MNRERASAPRAARPIERAYARLARLALGLLIAASGCEEPRFTADGDSCDGGACVARALATDGGDDDPRALWEGRYAVRTHLYLVDGLLQTEAELLSLVSIARDADGLVMEQQLCAYDGSWNAVLLLGRTRYEYPDLTARAKLTYDAQSFSSEPLATQMGMAELPAACNGASTAPSSQAWLSGTCECPKPNTLPANARDCRVIDADGDAKPGFSTHGQVNADTWTYFITQQQLIRFVAGYRKDDRLYASVEHRDTTQVMGCGGQSPAGCPNAVDQTCPAKYNPAELVPVAADFDCARVISQASMLFRLTRQPFSPTCKTELTNPVGGP